MNHGNCDTAVDMLKDQFRREEDGVAEVTQAWYSIWGDVVSLFPISFLGCICISRKQRNASFLTIYTGIGCILLH